MSISEQNIWIYYVGIGSVQNLVLCCIASVMNLPSVLS